MDDLLQWLGEQLDEDERIAHAAAKRVSAPPNDGILWRRDWDTVHTAPSNPPGPRVKVADCGHGAGDLTAHIAEHDPARVLREIDAKRRLLDDYVVTARIRDEAAARIKAAGDHPDSKDLDTWDRAQREAAILEGPVKLAASPLDNRLGYREEWRP